MTQKAVFPKGKKKKKDQEIAHDREGIKMYKQEKWMGGGEGRVISVCESMAQHEKYFKRIPVIPSVCSRQTETKQVFALPTFSSW